jgi:hypothetical protein
MYKKSGSGSGMNKSYHISETCTCDDPFITILKTRKEVTMAEWIKFLFINKAGKNTA